MLEECLRSVLACAPAASEIVVVDQSRDETSRLVVCRTQGGKVPVRYLRSRGTGLSQAKNQGIADCTSDIVAFTDDDAAPDRGWLRALVRHFNDPLVYCVTGLTLPLELETEAQEWHERYSTFRRGFRKRVFERTSINPMAAGQIGAGVNMALRKRTLELVGPFDEALDAGTRTRSGGDSEMFSRLLAAGCGADAASTPSGRTAANPPEVREGTTERRSCALFESADRRWGSPHTSGGPSHGQTERHRPLPFLPVAPCDHHPSKG